MRFKQVHKFNKKKRFPEKRLPGTAVAVENGNVDKAIRKLKKKLQKEGLLRELKQKQYFDNVSRNHCFTIMILFNIASPFVFHIFFSKSSYGSGASKLIAKITSFSKKEVYKFLLEISK